MGEHERADGLELGAGAASHDRTPRVYRVNLDDPEIDVNMHADAYGPVTEVMAPSGHVIERVLHPEPDGGG